MGSISEEVKGYILEQFLPGEDPAALTAQTPLIATGILDSIATLQLSTFLEERFDIQMLPHELDEEHIGTLERIEMLVRSKT
jgi:acyl carrier protein